MFWFAPLMGATVTAIIYEYAPLKPKKRVNKEDMGTAIFQSDEVRQEDEEDDDDEDEDEDNNEDADAHQAGRGGGKKSNRTAAAGGGHTHIVPTEEPSDDLFDDVR